MITVEEAKQIVLSASSPLHATTIVEVCNALGYTLAENIYAPLDLPPFNQSNVDGYAVNLSTINTRSWSVITEIKAGDNTEITLKAGEAARIFTGAMVPEGSDLVIMQEKMIRDGDTIVFNESNPLQKGEHIRCTGAQIKKNTLALNQGTICTPSIISFITGLGIDKIPVIVKPLITLIITGNELQTPGTELSPGKVYESNSAALQTALQSMGLSIHKILFVTDDKLKLQECIKEALQGTDMVLISGGISVGDYDYVKEALLENGTTTLFHKIAQRPGKPLYFGKNKNTLIFGLPGNPASALTCFYEYVFPALRNLQGRKNIFLKTVRLRVTKKINKKKGLAHFLKAGVTGNSVEPLDGQESFIVRSFADANAFIYLPLDTETIEAGEEVEVHLLPEV